MDKWHEGTSSLDPTDLMGEKRGKIEREKKEERERRNSRERDSTFSLDFSVIGPSTSGKTKGKVDPHCKSYAWVLVLWSFKKLQEVGVFS